MSPDSKKPTLGEYLLNGPKGDLPPSLMTFGSFAEFEAWEDEQLEEPFEYCDGRALYVFGQSPRHSAIQAEILTLLHSAYRADGGHTLGSRQRIRVAGQQFFYPDCSVVCGKPEYDRRHVLSNPTVIVEVMSRRTEARDRGLKWELYQQIESLRDYLLISQDVARVEHYRRMSEDTWRYRSCTAGMSVELAGSKLVTVDELYARVWDMPSDNGR